MKKHEIIQAKDLHKLVDINWYEAPNRWGDIIITFFVEDKDGNDVELFSVMEEHWDEARENAFNDGIAVGMSIIKNGLTNENN